MIRFHGGFISGQTGGMGKKPETEDGDVQKFQKKWMSQKIENRDYRIPMWFVDLGPCSFWFQANSIDSVKGVDLGVNRGYANTSAGSVTSIPFSDMYTHTLNTHTRTH